MKALDLFCGGGGASAELVNAGYEVTGVDLYAQPKYPYKFIQADALTIDLAGFDFIWASPVCKRFSSATKTAGTSHNWPDQIAPIRAKLLAAKIPFVIENVAGAPIRSDVMLCGTMFNLPLYRHRYFEIEGFKVKAPVHNKHIVPVTKMGRPMNIGEFINPVGHFSGVKDAQKALGINWLGQKELAQAIPPAYSEFLGKERQK